MLQSRPARARQVKMPLVMPRPQTLPVFAMVRVWIMPSPQAEPVLVGDFYGRHPGVVVASLAVEAPVYIALTPSGRHTAWTRPAPPRSEAA